MTDSLPLANKVAVITGAGRGIGKAIALAYGEAGAAIACAARTQAEIEQTAVEIEAAGGRAIAAPTDVRDMAAVDRLMAQTVEQLGGIDILVINAGINLDRNPIAESIPEEWRATMEVNLFGPYYCARAAIPHLRARGGGKIIIVGSGMGHRGSPGNSAYCISKAGVWMLTQVLAQEVWPDKISVNELIPGPVDTSMTTNAQARAGVAFATSSEWIKQPADVAPLALFLATQPDVGPTAQSFSLMRRA
ncbi:MAG: SDR family oxidoreductase [Caldilineaceae bacterium]